MHHWRRATNTFRRSRAHNLELKAARTFYAMHPEFVLGLPRPRSRHRLAARLTGRSVTAVDLNEVRDAWPLVPNQRPASAPRIPAPRLPGEDPSRPDVRAVLD